MALNARSFTSQYLDIIHDTLRPRTNVSGFRFNNKDSAVETFLEQMDALTRQHGKRAIREAKKSPGTKVFNFGPSKDSFIDDVLVSVSHNRTTVLQDLLSRFARIPDSRERFRCLESFLAEHEKLQEVFQTGRVQWIPSLYSFDVQDRPPPPSTAKGLDLCQPPRYFSEPDYEGRVAAVGLQGAKMVSGVPCVRYPRVWSQVQKFMAEAPDGEAATVSVQMDLLQELGIGRRLWYPVKKGLHREALGQAFSELEEDLRELLEQIQGNAVNPRDLGDMVYACKDEAKTSVHRYRKERKEARKIAGLRGVVNVNAALQVSLWGLGTYADPAIGAPAVLGTALSLGIADRVKGKLGGNPPFRSTKDLLDLLDPDLALQATDHPVGWLFSNRRSSPLLRRLGS